MELTQYFEIVKPLGAYAIVGIIALFLLYWVKELVSKLLDILGKNTEVISNVGATIREHTERLKKGDEIQEETLKIIRETMTIRETEERVRKERIDI